MTTQARLASKPPLPFDPQLIVIDALNLAYWRGSPPSLTVPLALTTQLLGNGMSAFLYFDASARHRLADEAMLYTQLLRYPGCVQEVPAGRTADAVMLKEAKRRGARVLSRDKYADHRKRHRRLIDAPGRLLSGFVKDGRVSVPLLEIDLPLPSSAEAAWEALQPLLVD